MLTFVIAVVVVILVLLFGMLLAWLFAAADRSVSKTKDDIEQTERAYNPAMTMGYKIKTTAESEAQVKEARALAAKQAAALPRGANMRIGRLGQENIATASQGVKQDPWTAAKIAAFHGWDGVRTGMPAGGVPATVAAPAAKVAPAKPGKIELVPGKDYPYIEITDDMSPDEMRKARIANSKAKSAAMKAAKAAGVPAAAPAQGAPAAAPAPAAPVVPANIEPPKLIEVTDDMPPDEVRKARIANSKARSAFNKALKAAGIDPSTVTINEKGEVEWPGGAPPAAPQPTAQVAPSAQPAAPAAGAGPLDLAALGIQLPELTKITDDMSPDEVRKARINNSKARSAFNKALKAAGIDPKDVEIDDEGNVKMPETAVPQAPAVEAPAPQAEQAAPVAAAPASGGKVDLGALGIEPPDYIEVSDDMDPEDVRKARVNNAKERSRVNKALKAAGLDPREVEF